jgi:hypothetical protein
LKYIRLTVRIAIALAFASIALIIGVYLPLLAYSLVHGDPGMPGGAGLVFFGVPIDLAAAITAGFFSFTKFPVPKQNSK